MHTHARIHDKEIAIKGAGEHLCLRRFCLRRYMHGQNFTHIHTNLHVLNTSLVRLQTMAELEAERANVKQLKMALAEVSCFQAYFFLLHAIGAIGPCMLARRINTF